MSITSVSVPPVFSQYVAYTYADPVSGSQQIVCRFPNGFGVSILNGGRSIYSDRGVSFEVAVIRFRSANSRDWDFAGNVQGWCSADRVREIMSETFQRRGE